VAISAGDWYLSVVVSDGRVRLFKWAGVNAFAQDPFYLDLQGLPNILQLSDRPRSTSILVSSFVAM